MKRKFSYLTLIALFAGTTAFVVVKYNRTNQEPSVYHLKQRKVTNSEEWKKTEQLAAKYIAVVERNPTDKKNALALAMLYIQEGRVTGDHVYYDVAAMHYVNQVLKLDSHDFEALTLKSLIELSKHHFTDGLETAKLAQKQNPYNAFVYGLLVDGFVETGNYDSAITQADKMVSIRPDIRSYSRISYLREIHGDLRGAIEAMQMAADAGVPGDETTEWARVQLAKLYEESGDLVKAEQLCQLSLSLRPDYAAAYTGLGHINLDRNNFKSSIEYYQKAVTLVNDQNAKEMIAKVYLAMHDKQRATELLNELINVLSSEAKKGEGDDEIGHYADKELAYAYLLLGKTEKALDHAIVEYNRRPDNIDVNETVAWAYYKNNQKEKAIPYIQIALKTRSCNPTLLAHAVIINQANGRVADAQQLFSVLQPSITCLDPDLKAELSSIMQTAKL